MKVRRLLFTLGLLVAIGSMGVLNAASDVEKGTFKGGTWSFNKSNGQLTISKVGDGALPDYEDSEAPWPTGAKVRSLILDESQGKITRIGKHAFAAMFKLDSVVQGYRPKNTFQINSLGREALTSFVTPYLYVSGNKEIAKHTMENSTPIVTLRDVETVWEYGLAGSHYMIDLGSNIKKLRAGSLKCDELWHTDGTPSVFIQADTPPEWDRLYDLGVTYPDKVFASVSYWFMMASTLGLYGLADAIINDYDDTHIIKATTDERELEYPFGDCPVDYGEIIVVVPMDKVETYKSFYKKNHPEVKEGYMCAGFTKSHYKGADTYSVGRFVGGEPIYKGNQLVGWWYRDGDELHIGYVDGVIPNYGAYFAPWTPGLEGAKKLHIHGNVIKGMDETALGNTSEIYLYGNVKIEAGAFLTNSKVQYINRGNPNIEAHLDLEENAFMGCKNLYSLGDVSISKLSKSCFEGCVKLSRVGTVDWTVKEIPERAFCGCSMLSGYTAALVDKKDKIGKEAFKGCAFTDVTFTWQTEIGEEAFADCAVLQDIHFGPGEKKLGKRAFYGCSQLKRIYIEDGNTQNWDKVLVDAKNDTYRGENVMDKLILYIDPDYYLPYEKHPVYSKMQVNKEKWLPVRGSLQHGSVVWELSSDHTLTFTPVGFNGQYSYYQNDYYIPDFKSVEDQPWYIYRKDIHAIMLKSVADASGNIFGITRIGKYAFAFANGGESNITDVHIPRTCKQIGECAFLGNQKLVSVHIEDVEEIDDGAFAECWSIQTIDLKKSFKKGGRLIFQGCINLKELDVQAVDPAAITESTFDEMDVTFFDGPEYMLAADGKQGGQENVTLTVPAGALNNYLVDENWNKFHFDLYDSTHGNLKKAGKFGDGMWILWEDGSMDITANNGPARDEEITFPDDVKAATTSVSMKGEMTSVPDNCFKGFDHLQGVSLPQSVKKIGHRSFMGCAALEDINLSTIDTIGTEAFSNIWGGPSGAALTAVTLPSTKLVGIAAFRGCEKLSSISLGDETEVKSDAFGSCNALTAVDLGKASLTASGIFAECKGLLYVTYNGSELPYDIFSGCTSLRKVTLGSCVGKLGSGVFRGCTALDTIVINRPDPSEMYVYDETGFDTEAGYIHYYETPFGRKAVYESGSVWYDYFIDHTKVNVIVPELYADAYRKADIWKEMKINGKETELEFPIRFAIGPRTTGIIDDKGNLRIEAEGEMDGTPATAIAAWRPYITNSIEFDYQTKTIKRAEDQKDGVFAWMTEFPKTITFGALMENIGKYAFYSDSLDATTVFNCYADKPVRIEYQAFNWEVLNANGAKPKLHIVNDPEVIEAWNKETYASVWKEHFDIVADLEKQNAPAQYTVTFVDGLAQGYLPAIISEQVVDLGKSAVAPTNVPEYIGYVFDGWDGDYTNVTEDRMVIANYTYTTHDVYFWAGRELWEKQEVPHGGAAQAPYKTPEMPGYVFDHWGWWSEKHDNVFKDFNVQAIWKQLVKATGITLDPDIKTINTNTAELQAGITFQITPTIVPVAAGNQQLIWSSNNTDVATVDQNGLVTITMATDVYNDVAIIKAVTTDGSELYAECVVDVTNEDNVMVPVYATSVRILGSKEITIYRGQNSEDPTKVRVVVEPSDYNQGIFAFLWNADMQDFEPGGNPEVLNVDMAYDESGNPLKGTFDIYAPFYDPTLYPSWQPYDVNVFFRVQTGSDPDNILHDTLKVHVVQDIIFTENNAQNIPITYRVIDNDTKTCETYSSQDPETSAWTPFMPYEVSGDNGYVSIPTKAREYNVVRVNGECASENITTMEFDNGIQHIAGAPAVPMIKKVILPKSYKRLDNSIFANNDMLKDVYIYAKTAPKEPFAKSYGVGYTNAFDQIGEGHATLHVVKGCKAEYNVKPWTDWFETITDDLSATHVVTFLDYDGSLIDMQNVEYGDSAITPNVPYHDGRTFTGWDKKFDRITADLTVTALYNEIKYTVTFVDWNGTKLQETQVAYGEAVTAPADPSRNGYLFKGWDKKFDNITENTTVTAVYAKLYTVSFIDWDGTELKSESVEEGQSAHEPSVPFRAGYRFSGWDTDFYNVQSDLIVQAQYVQDIAEGIEEATKEQPAPSVRKVLINGQLYILRQDGAIFNASGMRIK